MMESMGSPPPAPLRSLLRPRTLLRLGPEGGLKLWASARLKPPVSGQRADVAVVSGRGKRLAERVKQASLRARAVVLPGSSPVDPVPGEAGLQIGPGGGLWTPALRVGLVDPGYTAREGAPVLVIAEDLLVARQLHGAARRLALPLAGIITTGEGRRDSWLSLVAAAAALDPAPPLLVALHGGPLSCAALGALADHPQQVAVLLMGHAGGKVTGSGWPLPRPLSAEEVGGALGLAIAGDLQQLAAAGSLLSRGPVPPRPTVFILGRSDGELALLRDAWARAAAPGQCELDTSLMDGARKHAPASRPDLTLSGAAPLHRAFEGRLASVALEEEPGDALATLSALNTLAGAAASRVAPGPRRRGVSGRAAAVLQEHRQQLDELGAKELVACYGMDSVGGELVLSASAAGRLAGELGQPVAIKAVGPELRQRQGLGAVALDVPTPSAARQAFRDVLAPLGDSDPPVLLHGVLVSPMIPLPAALDCAITWPHGADALMVLTVRHGEVYPNGRQVLRCPLNREGARRAAALLAEEGLWGPDSRPDDGDVRKLGTTLERLSWIGPDLAGLMAWLRLDTVSPPEGSRPALVIDAYGERR